MPPKIKIEPNRIIVCCGEHDCVEIETGNGDQAGGNDPWEPPISGGLAFYTPLRSIVETLQLQRRSSLRDFWSQFEQIEQRYRGTPPDQDLALTLRILVPPGSKLRLPAVQALSRRLGANVEVHFTAQDE